MSHYKANLRDLEFNLYEFLKTNERLGQGAFADLDEASAQIGRAHV